MYMTTFDKCISLKKKYEKKCRLRYLYSLMISNEIDAREKISSIIGWHVSFTVLKKCIYMFETCTIEYENGKRNKSFDYIQ